MFRFMLIYTLQYYKAKLFLIMIETILFETYIEALKIGFLRDENPE